MDIPLKSVETCPSVSEIKETEREWKWFLGLGIFSIIFGIIAFSALGLTTLASVLLLGWLLLVSGIVQAYQAIKARKGKEFFLHLTISILYVVIGFLMISNPGIVAVSLTLLLASFFMVGGVFRIIGAIAMRFRNWGWVTFNGIVALLLGLMIWRAWPVSGLWVIGLFVGIEMIINGWSLVMFATAAREEIGEVRERCYPATV